MAWIDPVYDRTRQDVERRTAKAFCNAADLNRVEGDCEALAALLGVSIVTKTDWTLTDFHAEAALARVRGNVAALREAYYTHPFTPATPQNPLTSWQKWNAAEAILADLYELYLLNAAAMSYAGETYAGETIGVI